MRSALLQLFLFALVLQSCKQEPEQIKPTLAPIIEAVYASVNVMPSELYTIYPSAAGIIEAKYIHEGDTVAEGQTLFVIKNAASDVNLEAAQLNYELIKSNYKGQANVLKELEQQIEIAQLKLANNKMLLTKQENLWAKGIGSENEL